MAKSAYAIINKDGTIRQQTGEINPDPNQTKRLDKGKYQVVFNADHFKATPYVSLTVMTSDDKCGSGGTNRTISITSVSKDKVCVGIKRASGGDDNDDRPFTLLAVTPQ